MVKLSIIVATSNRAASLGRLLESLAPQLKADRHELFIAENGSPRRSPIPSLPIPTVHLYEASPGKCRVQNRAIQEASGEVMVFVDDDLTAAPDYLEAVESFVQEHPEFAAMKGRILPVRDPVAAIGDKAAYLDLPIVDHGDSVIEVRGMMGASMAIRVSALKAVGLFDERLGPGASGHEEDTEMSERLRRVGFHIGYAPRAVAFHEVDPARADRERFLRVARWRGRCRVMHESHAQRRVMIDLAVARFRLAVAKAMGAPLKRIAREERRVAVAAGMLEGLRAAKPFWRQIP